MKQKKKYVCQLAGKLLAEGLQPSNYTKRRAKSSTQNVVGKKFIHDLINTTPVAEVKKAMKKIKSGKSC